LALGSNTDLRIESLACEDSLSIRLMNGGTKLAESRQEVGQKVLCTLPEKRPATIFRRGASV
jgi:hypothetical protein